MTLFLSDADSTTVTGSCIYTIKAASVQDSWKVFADLPGLSLARSLCVDVPSLFLPQKNGAWRFPAAIAQQGWVRCRAASPFGESRRWI